MKQNHLLRIALLAMLFAATATGAVAQGQIVAGFGSGGQVVTTGNSRIVAMVGSAFGSVSNTSGQILTGGMLIRAGKTATASEEEIQKPEDRTLSLAQNYPNPFREHTSMTFTLPEEGPVRIDVYDMLGRLVMTPVDREMPAGPHELVIDGSHLAGGVYVVVFKAGARRLTRRIVVLK